MTDHPPRLSRRALLAGAAGAGALAIGPFATAASAQAGPSASVIQTSGYRDGPRGAALYVADPTVDRAFVAANPRTAFLTADGRGFRLSLDQTVTPFMFGARGFANFTQSDADFAALPDDSEALQAFFDFCAVQRVEDANWGGVFGVSRGLTMGGPLLSEGGKSEESFRSTDSFSGDLVLAVRPGSEIHVVLTNNARRQTAYGPVAILGPNDEFAWGRRLFDIGILFQNKAQMQTFTSVNVSRARYAGVLVQSGRQGYDNTFHNHFENAAFYRCGSGSLSPASFQTARFSGRTDSGNAGDAFQRSVLTVTALPPAWMDTHGAVDFSNLPLLVRHEDELYAITGMDRTANRVSVYPWLPRGTNSGAISYVYGGGLVAKGDGGLTTGKLSAIDCSIGYHAAAGYNGYVTATVQNNYIGLAIGRYVFHGNAGGSTRAYFEGNVHDVLWNANDEPAANHRIEAQHTIDFRKIRGIRPRNADGSLKRFSAHGLVIELGRYPLTFENQPDEAGNWSSVAIAFDRPNSHILPLHGDAVTVDVTFPPNPAFEHLFGYRARTIQVVGNGPNREPREGVTVNSATPGRRINGGAPGAPARITGFRGPATLQLSLDPADPTNCIVAVMGGK
jgi:hypothetical protein